MSDSDGLKNTSTNQKRIFSLGRDDDMGFIKNRTRKLLFGLIAVTVLVSLCGCSRLEKIEESTKSTKTIESTDRIVLENTDFFSVVNFYLNYIECSTLDSQAAVRTYIHYEQEWLKEIALEQNDPTTGCDFLEVKKLNDKLWLIKTFITSSYRPEGFICDNFVGIVDGQLYVMVNLYNIPPELKEGLDLSEYHKEGMYE